MLRVQQLPHDKSGLGFNSNNKNKSNVNKKHNFVKKKGQGQAIDLAKIVCFKCKVQGHHVRSCPLKKKPISEKQQGKRPQVPTQASRVEEPSLPKKKGKSRLCYKCRGKDHFASSCTHGTLSNPSTIDNVHSPRKDKVGNVFAKYVGTQSGVKKRTIWVAKPIVTNLLGPNLVGDQQAKT